MRTCIILNPNAGSAGDLEQLRAGFDRLTRHGEEHEIRLDLTTSAEHAGDCAASAASAGFTRFIAAGGDGTINRIVNGLARARGTEGLKHIELGILPLGTGNDFSNSIGMNPALLSREQAMDALAAWRTKAIDLVEVRASDEQGRPLPPHLFLNASAGGFVKDVGQSADPTLKRSALGSLSYALTAASNLEEAQHYNLCITVDGQPLTHRAMATVVSNGRTVGGGIEIAPEAKLDDGLIEITIVPEAELSDLFLAGIEAFTGTKSAGILETHRGREIRLECTTADSDVARMPLSADGEGSGFTPAMYTVLPRAIQVVVGPDA
jgi:diacylglycerol kinase (ATP)